MSVRILNGDCIELMATLDECSVDAIVTDPPYGLEFMGKDWDAPWKQVSGGFSSPGIGERNISWPSYRGSNGSRCAACGMLVGHGGSPCRCATPMPVRDDSQRMRVFQSWCEQWARQALRVLKPGGHLLSFGGTRTYHRMVAGLEDAGFEIRDQIGWLFGSGFPKSRNGEWGGTALKPAWEPIVVARKPLCGTVEANWLAHGVGGFNIDGCRIGFAGEHDRSAAKPQGKATSKNTATGNGAATPDAGRGAERKEFVSVQGSGRWPANVIHDGSDEVLAAFPEAPGQLAKSSTSTSTRASKNVYGDMARGSGGAEPRADAGSAARFFYCAKASRADRHAGLENPGPQIKTNCTLRQVETTEFRGNIHPTVKPTALMRYLCRLVTPAGGLVLDPFLGSGSTGRGAVLEGFDFIGIEKDIEHGYVAIAEARIADAVREREEEQAAAAAANAQIELFAGHKVSE